MQTLIQAGYINAFKGYYTETKYRTKLFTKTVKPKTLKPKETKNRTKASIEPKLTPTLNVMIEGALLFSTTIKNNAVDLEMVKLLKELRRISQTEKLTKSDIAFLNNLDLSFMGVIGAKDRPLSVWVAHGLVQELKVPTRFNYHGCFGGRYGHLERGI